MQTMNKTYTAIEEFNMDAGVLSNSGWKVQNSTTIDNRKGSWGWFALWIIVGLFTLVGFIGCLFTFPRGELVYHVTYVREDTK